MIFVARWNDLSMLLWTGFDDLFLYEIVQQLWQMLFFRLEIFNLIISKLQNYRKIYLEDGTVTRMAVGPG